MKFPAELEQKWKRGLAPKVVCRKKAKVRRQMEKVKCEENIFRRKWEDDYEFKVWSLWNMDLVAVIYSKSQLLPNRKINIILILKNYYITS